MHRMLSLPGLIRHSSLALLLLTGLAAGIVGAAPALPAAAEPDFATIDSYIDAQMREQRIPGLALGIVHGDEIVHLKGFGIANPNSAPVTAQTPFSIGSLTKSFTALAITQLVEADKLDLDMPVQRYLPWFRVADPAASAQITLRHLLNHASGLPRTLETQYENRADEGAATLEARLRSLSTTPLERPLGSYGYSNAGYQVLAMVIQQVTGQSYEAYVRQHIFEPLAMQQSFTSLAAANEHGMATGYHYWFGMPVAAELPAYRVGPGNGGLFASAEDMAHYLIAHLNQGPFGTATVLSPAGIAELHRPAVARTPEAGFYAMGWSVQTADRRTTLAHSGQSYNYLAKMMIVPEAQWGVVVLQNAQYTVKLQISGDSSQDRIADGVMSMLLGSPLPQPQSTTTLLLIYAGFALLIGIQLLELGRSVVVLRRWRAHPEQRPHSSWALIWRIGAPLVLSLGWAVVTLIILPLSVGQDVAYQIPDLSATLLASGVIALASSGIKLFWLGSTRRKLGTGPGVTLPV